MSSIMRTTRRGLLGLLLIIPAFANATSNAVGATAGQFAVQGGAATYTVPLTLPPGLGEMKPELALSYNSNGGDGPLGLGWSVSGLSAITLCPKTVAQDGAYVAASKSTAAIDQRYCLDGQRLVLTSGSWGTASAVMRTEIDNFSRVTIASWSGAVPNSFIVKTKAGQTLYYGATDDARSHVSTTSPNPAIAWFVNQAVDAKGNYINFTYFRPNSTAGTSPETLISRIDYTGNQAAGVSPYASVSFSYQARPSTRHYHAGGYRFESSQRLASIQTRVNSTDVRSYTLGYGVLTRTGEPILTSLQECATQNSTPFCLPTTDFQWNQTDVRINSVYHPVTNTWGGLEWVRSGDFNGDGLMDIASPSGSSVFIKFGDPVYGFTNATWSTQSNWTNADSLLVGDFDGDGRTDFAFPSGTSIQLKLARNGTFVDQLIAPVMTGGATAAWGPAASTFVAEINGDGKADIVTFVGGPVVPRVYLRTGTGFEGSAWSIFYTPYPATEARDNFATDLNGDGITDFVIFKDMPSGPDSVWFLTTNAAAKSFSFESVSATLTGWDRRLQSVADFDGDGLPEYGCILSNAGQSSLATVVPPSRGAGSGFSKTLPAVIPDDRKDWTWLADFDGDGRVDVLTRQAGGNSLAAYQQSGAGFKASALSTALGWPAGAPVYLGDFSGDGHVDIALRYSTTSINLLGANHLVNEASGIASYLGNSGNLTQPEAIAQITSGDGAIIKIDYRTMAQGTAGSTAVAPGAPAVAGETTVGAPIWLVNEVWSSHGVGPSSETRGTSYQYFNLRMSTTGRGVLGFEAETVRDLLTGDWELTEYETSWPKNGTVKRKTSYLADGTRVKTLEQQSQYIGTINAGPVFPYVSLSTETAYDDVGNPMVISTTEPPRFSRRLVDVSQAARARLGICE